MKIQESAENYLESVLILQKQKGHVRSIDIVNYLDFSKPSVSVAMKNLRENGYIHMDDGYITLTENGRCLPHGTHYEHGKFYRYQELYHPEPSLKKDNPDPHEDPGCLFSFYFVSIS